jgi:mono/diheme cytochrome c family protein
MVALRLSAAVALSVIAVSAGAKPQAAAPVTFTAAQAAEGAKVYETACAMCHGRDLAGTVEIPALTGRFLHNWSGRPVGDLFAYLAKAMPQFAPGSLAPQDNARIIAYLLSANGYAPGAAPLPADGKALSLRVLPAPSQMHGGAESEGLKAR